MAGATVNPVQAAFAHGVTNTKGVWLTRTVDGVGLYLHPGSAVQIAFAGPDIQLQFLGDRTSGRVRLFLGTTQRDVDLRTARAHRWLITMHTTGNGPHELTILDLPATKAGHHVGNAVLSQLHVLPGATSRATA